MYRLSERETLSLDYVFGHMQFQIKLIKSNVELHDIKHLSTTSKFIHFSVKKGYKSVPTQVKIC